MAKIKLDYDPTIDYAKLEKILNDRYPEYTTLKPSTPFRKHLTLKKNIFVHAHVLIKQKSKKNQTIITVVGGMKRWTIYIFGVLIHYAIRGNFIKEVAETLQRDLQKQY